MDYPEVTELKQILKDEGFIDDHGNVDYKSLKKVTGIPDRTFRSWFLGERIPAPWVLDLLKFYFKNGGFKNNGKA